MTDKPTPTDAEIDAIADQHKASGYGTVWPHAFARAILAKWGAQPVAAPRNATLYDPHDVAFPVQHSADGVDLCAASLGLQAGVKSA